MTKTKKAVKQVNKEADAAILKSKIANKVKVLKTWLCAEVEGIQRWKLIAMVGIPVAIALSLG
tara:strand:+ start:1147 stop:1335 length:189 start_codon:yes stop_codon:yes gene_type:complete